MHFEKAFDLAFEKESERMAQSGEKFAVSPATAKTLAFLWNMLALSDGTFDDIVYIDSKNNIVSIPLDNDSDDEPKKKGRKKKPSGDEGVNGTENS
jgi:hypothetical protein